MGVVLLAGAALRAVAWRSLRPATWFSGDSFSYVADAVHPAPDMWRPSGYSMVLLLPLRPFHSLAAVTVVQHLLGVGVGVAVYALLLRHGLPIWAATLAAGPVLLDAYVVSTEQMVLSETLFTALVVGAAMLLLWSPQPPGAARCAFAGLLLGVSAVTRSVGLPLVAVAALTLLIRRAGARRTGALLLAAALPLGGYVTWFHRSYGQWATSASSGLFLYGRVAQFADCDRLGAGVERALCPTEPVGARRHDSYYVFDSRSPVHRLGTSMRREDDLAGRFARRAIRNQPGDYAAQTAGRLGGLFSVRNGRSAVFYRLDGAVGVPSPAVAAIRRYEGGAPRALRDPRGVRALVAYQRVMWVPGAALLAALLLSVAGVAFGRDPRRRALRSAVVLLGGSSLVLFVVPALTVGADLRYRLPPLPLLAISTGLAVALLVERAAARRPAAVRRRSRGRTARPGPARPAGESEITKPLDITQELPPLDPP